MIDECMECGRQHGDIAEFADCNHCGNKFAWDNETGAFAEYDDSEHYGYCAGFNHAGQSFRIWNDQRQYSIAPALMDLDLVMRKPWGYIASDDLREWCNDKALTKSAVALWVKGYNVRMEALLGSHQQKIRK